MSYLDRNEKRKEVSPRIAGLRRRFVDVVPEISTDRAKIVTDVYTKNFSTPAVLRRARALEAVLDNIRIYLGEGELIVGGLAEKPRSVPLFPEYDVDFILDELDTLDSRIADRFTISEENKQVLRDILPCWQGQTIKDAGLRAFPADAKETAADLIHVLTALKSGVGHMIIDYEQVIHLGLKNIIAEIKATKDCVTFDDPECAAKRNFYDAAVICLEATIRFARRFSQLARAQAAEETDPLRRAELETIAAICTKVPAKPAENFWEACQSLWFIHVVLHLECNGHSVSLGHFDRYLFPYYEKTVAESPSGKDFARELIHCLWIKFSEINKLRDKVSSVAFGGYPMFQHITLGGQDTKGRSTVNELSHACLEATAQVGLHQPSTSIRWHYGAPDDFLHHAVEVAAYGTGMPAFFNDEVLIPNMLQAGFSIEEARDYAVVGCTEQTVPGISEPWLTGGFLNLPKVLERTLFNGYDPVREKQNPFQTGEAQTFSTYETLQEAYFKQLAHYLRHSVTCDNLLDELHGQLVPNPFEAAFIHGCIEKGKTTQEGGARFNSTTINAVGIANAADSLAAIKKLVYEEQQISWEELLAALRTDFEGNEKLRQRLLHNAPKYGNDDPYVDQIGSEILDHLHREIGQYHNPRGGPYYIALYSIACHVLLADSVGALPDGRKRGMVLADGGVSCSQGRDEKGPTALLNSVVRLDSYKAVGSTLLNAKLHPRVFDDPENMAKVAALIKTYFLNKGQHIQLNVIDAETLRDAQKHPEEYPFLVVRVAGFSVQFTTIDPLLQEDIILRTAHEG